MGARLEVQGPMQQPAAPAPINMLAAAGAAQLTIHATGRSGGHRRRQPARSTPHPRQAIGARLGFYFERPQLCVPAYTVSRCGEVLDVR